jgi:hypothetical protein
VIEEDHPQAQATQQIEPEIALDGTHESYVILMGHHVPSILSYGALQCDKCENRSLAKMFAN